MSRDWYFAPAGSGTSGSGSKNSPIVGLSTIGSVGIAEGDRVIVSGRHYERLIIPQNGIRVTSDGAIFDGTWSLNGNFSINSSTENVDGLSAWVLVDAGLNVWKKGCQYLPMLLIDDEWREPMPTSINTNSAATILANIAEHEWTIRDETIDGLVRAIYIRLPIGENPAQHNIRLAQRTTVASTKGVIQASQKTKLVFEGQFNMLGIFDVAYPLFPFWFDRCEGVSNRDADFYTKYSYWGLRVSAGGDIDLSARGEYLYNPVVSLDCADEYTGTQYSATGNIYIRDWYANYCGWMPRYNGQTAPNYGNDADGGVGIGYKGGIFKDIEITGGLCKNGGPSQDSLKTGWSGAATTLKRGCGIIAGTVNATEIDSLKVNGNLFDNQFRNAIAIGGTAIVYKNSIEVVANVIANSRPQKIAVNEQQALISCVTYGVSQLPINFNLSDNLFVGGYATINLISVGVSAAGGQASNITMCNNVVQSVGLEPGYTSQGTFKFAYACTGTKLVNGNITDGPLGGVYGRYVSTNYANFAAWQAAGYDLQGQQGTVTVNDDYSLTAGTANPIGAGVKYWGAGPRPNDKNGNPLPDIGIDIGPVQGTLHPFHPANLKKV